MGKCSQCKAELKYSDHNRAAARSNEVCESCSTHEAVGGSADNHLGDEELEKGVRNLQVHEGSDNLLLKRAVAATSEKLKFLQETVRMMAEKQESGDHRCRERIKPIVDLAKLVETQEKAIQSLQGTVAMQNVQITQLNLQLKEFESRAEDGCLMWKIPEYKKKKHEAATLGPASFYSDSFFTSRHGYKMCGRVYLNGDGVGKGTHLSIFFAIKKGEYDAFLKWPFSQRVCFRLLNQSGGSHVDDAFRPDISSSSFSRPQNEMNIASGCPLFVSQEVVENPQRGFLKNDTLYLQIEVDTSDL